MEHRGPLEKGAMLLLLCFIFFRTSKGSVCESGGLLNTFQQYADSDNAPSLDRSVLDRTFLSNYTKGNCQLDCIADCGCIGFTYASDYSCRLYSRYSGTVRSRGKDFYLRGRTGCSSQLDTFRTYSDSNSNASPYKNVNTTVEECKEVCIYDCNCVGFMHFTLFEVCFLFDYVNGSSTLRTVDYYERNGKSSGTNIGVIVGAVVGGLGAIVLIIIGITLYICFKRKGDDGMNKPVQATTGVVPEVK